MKHPRVTRRTFLSRATAASLAGSLPMIVPSRVLGLESSPAPSNRITVGCIGMGPQGRGVMSNFLAQKDAQVVAVSDVKKQQLDDACAAVNQRYAGKDCAVYERHEELLARPDIDVVLIATPDHWHVPVALAAIRAGKDVYLEKPMGLTLAEDQLLRAAVRKHHRVFQFGTQQRSDHKFRWACELARNGRIGKLKHINVWSPGSVPGGATTPLPVPPGLNYDRWLGPAPYTDYTEDKCAWDSSKKTWWYNYDYALGFIAGWGVHPLDIALWGGGSALDGKVEVQGSGVFPKEGACNTTASWDIDFAFASGVTMKYIGLYASANTSAVLSKAKAWNDKYRRTTSHGTAFEGTDGWVHVDRDGINASPESLLDEPTTGWDIQLYRSGNHVRNLLDCVKSRQPAICSIEEAVQADLFCHLSDIATRLKRKLVWDPAAEQFVNDAEANRRLQFRPAREPWGSILKS